LSVTINSVFGNSPGGDIFTCIFFLLAHKTVLSDSYKLQLDLVNNVIINVEEQFCVFSCRLSNSKCYQRGSTLLFGHLEVLAN
jgi:hypothetical protein